MRRISIKLKITLWFILFMLILAGIVFVFISLVSKSESHRNLQNALVSMVQENAKEVEYDDGVFEIEDDFVAYRNGLYCLVLDEDGMFLGGRTPEDALEKLSFEDDTVRKVTSSGEDYLIYDLSVIDKKREIRLRGIVSKSTGAIETASLYDSVLISIPLLFILAAAGGYFFAGRSLRPIRTISRTAEEIGISGDLSKRIAIDENGDELHRLAGTFNKMFDKLERNFEAERQFTADASHELRTPITTILAQCEYAFENASGEKELYEIIGDIQKQGYRMSRLVESLLFYTRLEQQTETPVFEELDLSACVRKVCMDQKQFSEKGIVLSEDIQPDIRLVADAMLISRMLENLIRNAYRYGKEGGTISVSLRKEGNEIILRVADDGIGISSEDLPKIWNRFYRVEKSRAYGKGSGLGLGLSMVKQIVRLHNGGIAVESEPGKGSNFTIRCPGGQI